MLSLGLAALQLMLDRGEQKDWFSSTEIIVEAVLAVLGLYLFVVHMCYARRGRSSRRASSATVNFTAGLLMMFSIGMVLLASSALAGALSADPRAAIRSPRPAC